MDEAGEPIEDPMWFVNLNADTADHWHLYNDVLYEYSDVLEGEDIVTVATVGYTMPGKLYAQTQTGSGSIGFEFDVSGVPLEVKSGDTITIAGTMSSDRRHGATMKHCEIIGFGEIAKDLKSDADNQRSQLEPLRPEEAVDAEPLNSGELVSQLKEVCWSMQLSWPTLAQHLR